MNSCGTDHPLLSRILRSICTWLLVAAVASSGCAFNTKYTEWSEPTEVSREALGEPRKADDGQCVRDFRVQYEEIGVTTETTNKYRSSVFSVVGLALASVGLFALAIIDNEALWLMGSLASGGISVVWGIHTLIVAATADPPRQTSRRTSEDLTLTATGCDRPVEVASAECTAGALVDRKLEQLEELRRDELIDDAGYAAERDTLQASRCLEEHATDGDGAKERLERLKQLREDGLVTEEEYRKKRQAILDAL